MPSVVLSPRANGQIAEVLAYTFEQFGERKYLEYRDLIASALRVLEIEPTAGKRRVDIHPDAWVLHVAQTGRRARHLFLYRVRDDVEVAALLHDAMDLPGHRPGEWGP